MADTIHAADGGVELLEETPSDPVRLNTALEPDGDQPSNQEAWSDLSMQVPNEATSARILSFVECVLVELTHEPVGAIYRSNEEWGVIETVTVHADWTSMTTDDPFVRFRRDPRTGLQASTYSRAAIRDGLVDRISREGPEHGPITTDSFSVYPVSTLSRLD